jgi:hypothetical protein
LQWVFLSTVAFFFSGVVAFAFCHGSAFSGFVEADLVSLMLLAFGTVRGYFFWNVHVFHYQLSIKKTLAFLYLFAIQTLLVAKFSPCSLCRTYQQTHLDDFPKQKESLKKSSSQRRFSSIPPRRYIEMCLDFLAVNNLALPVRNTNTHIRAKGYKEQN